MPSLLRLFRRPDYKSEVTQFIDQLKAQRPEIEAGQRDGRALLWDRNLDREAIGAWKEARVPQKAYVYGSEPQRRG